ncbi:hypothetical protein [Brevundimonas nasdae]|uniref:hypothetical protein n=1 Tax=Brevundimonas nasdae TaxID=172043 RepID=UPI0028981FCE|nr:hypothetical protein [Brevundimonas nasdae]
MSAPHARPEGDWTWRRAFIFGARIGLLVLLTIVIHRAPPQALHGIAMALIAWGAMESTYYLIAPSATEIIRFVSEIRPRLALGLKPSARDPSPSSKSGPSE